MRPIDADAYAADLWKLRENYQMLDDTHTADKIMHGIFRAEQVLKEQPTLAASPWHRVEDGLPKVDEYVLVWGLDKFSVVDKWCGDKWLFAGDAPIYSHWQRIEPPKEEA